LVYRPQLSLESDPQVTLIVQETSFVADMNTIGWTYSPSQSAVSVVKRLLDFFLGYVSHEISFRGLSDACGCKAFTEGLDFFDQHGDKFGIVHSHHLFCVSWLKYGFWRNSNKFLCHKAITLMRTV